MAAITMANRDGSFIESEAEGYRSRDSVTVDATGGALVAGSLLGKLTTAGAASVADAGNTGNGALTVDATDPVLADGVPGAYVVTITEAATNGGQYVVESPSGDVIGVANVGDTFADQIKFVLADGATDFIVGDFFTITVSAGSGKWEAYSASRTDGTGTVSGILFEGIDAVEASRTVIARDAEVALADLTYTGTEATVVAELAALGIITR